MSNEGRIQAQMQAMHRRTAGSPVTVGGVATYAITLSLTATSAGDYMPDGIWNAANADPRIFNVTPADFTTPPLEGASVSAALLGASYTVLRVLPEIYAGTLISWRLVCYRTPAEGASTTDSDTGLRKSFAPPEQP